MAGMPAYEEKDTWIHGLNGMTKLVFLLLWTVTCLLSYDTRVLLAMAAGSLMLYKMSGTRWEQAGTAWKFVLFFLLLHLTAVFLLWPYGGVDVYGTRTELCPLPGGCCLTAEQLFYEWNILLKYAVIAPAAVLFMATANPGELAASLDGIGAGRHAGYAAAAALRYLPDRQDDFVKIRNAREARGMDMSRSAPFFRRMKNKASVFFLMVSAGAGRRKTADSVRRLRGFGKRKKRTWYMGKGAGGADYAALAVTVALAALFLAVTFHDGNRFYNPFTG